MKLGKEQKRLWQTLLFLLKILMLAVPLYLIIELNIPLNPLQEAVSRNLTLLLNLFGFNVIRDGFSLSVNGFIFYVSEDCTGWKSMLFLTALMIAFPDVETKKRIIGLVVGLPLVWIGNIGRIIILIFIDKYYGIETMMVAHDYFWQLGLISLVLMIWLVWIWIIKRQHHSIIKNLFKF